MNVLKMSQVDNLIPEHIKSSLNEAEVDSDGEINMDRVPFAKNTIRMDLKQIDRSLKAMSSQQNKENLKNTCEPDVNQNRTCTPDNEHEAPAQPLTPTANLKVLFNAMSPELRHRDEQKQSTSDEDVSPMNSQDYQFETVIEVPLSGDMDSKFGPSRKEKSLGLLCQRFLQMYPEHPEEGEKIEICLDEVAKDLQVERRRIYDIINVLESVEIVSRVAKNRYAWHGKRNLNTTLAKLKALGDSEGFGEQIQRLKDFEFNRELEEQFGRSDPRLKTIDADFSIFGESSLFNQALRKDKSLGIMSQKFLMLFLVSKPKTVNLDLSAKLLIGDANVDRTENSKFKTKIRRLYDIANILTSLDLIRKVHVTEIRGRKPAFKYVGPDIDTPSEVPLSCCSDGCHRPTSRHSMLDCIQNGKVAKIFDNYSGSQPSKGSSTDKDGKLGFARHTSFETLCAVATVETNKLNSEPSSPVKMDQKTDGTETESDDAKSKLPTRGFVRKKFVAKEDYSDPNRTNKRLSAEMKRQAEAIIIKTKPPCGKQPTVIPLTKEQIDAVLRSLKVPVPVNKNQVIDATTQSEPVSESSGMEVEEEITVTIEETPIEEQSVGMKDLNEKTPIVMLNTPEKTGNKRPAPSGDSIPVEKRVKLDFASSASVADDQSPVVGDNAAVRFKKKVADVAKPSPQRALHLAPEFVNPSVTMAPSGDASSNEHEKVITQLINYGEKPTPKKIEIIINESGVQTSLLKAINVGSPKKVTQSHAVLQLPNDPSSGIVLQNTNPSASKPNSMVVQLSNNQAVQLSNNQAPTILQLPVVNIQNPSQQGMHIIQGGQVVQIPCMPHVTMSPASSASSPRVFSLNSPSSQATLTFTNVQLIPQTSQKGPSTVTTLIRPVATKATASPNAGSQIVAPQGVNQSPVYISKAPGGFVPITNAAVTIPKVIVASSNVTVKEKMPPTSILTGASS